MKSSDVPTVPTTAAATIVEAKLRRRLERVAALTSWSGTTGRAESKVASSSKRGSESGSGDAIG